MRLINTRSDLDAIAGTPEHDAFINVLKGSIYRLEKDDTAQQWVLVTDTTTIEKYGFTVADFTDLTPPEVPVYVDNTQLQINADALAYLASTDWIITRMAENGTPVAIEVLTKRAEARLSIV
jgi:hypothetical protein